jgi:NADPH:quinone reductase-like Zn-dependent oxidoreductase
MVHWPFPNHHPPGCDVNARNPHAVPYIHESYMRTWRKMEELADRGLVRHIGTSNMTIPKMKLLLRDARIKPAVNEMELHPHFQQPEFFRYLLESGICGNHAVLITGLGPVGLAAGALCRKLGAQQIIGIEIARERLELAMQLGVCDHVLAAGPDNVSQVHELTGGNGVERAVDCSANADARATAIRSTRKWGKMVMVGEGGTVTFNPSPNIIHDQKTIFGSWVTSTWLMEELVERLVRWGLHPEDIITHRFTLEQADEAYALMASGRCGKVAVCPTS